MPVLQLLTRAHNSNTHKWIVNSSFLISPYSELLLHAHMPVTIANPVQLQYVTLLMCVRVCACCCSFPYHIMAQIATFCVT